MDGSLIFDNEKYISAKLAAKTFGYASDYIGQLCRGKKVKARLVGRSWYVLEDDLIKHKKNINDLPRKVNRSVTKINKKVLEEVTLDVPEQSKIQSVRDPEIFYTEDTKELFPNLVRKFDIDSLKYLSLESADERIKKENPKSLIEKLALNFSVASFLLLMLSGLFFGRENLKNISPSKLVGNIKNEVSFLYNPYKENLAFYSRGLTGYIPTISSNKYNLAASFSGVGSVTDWAINLGRRIIKPWLEKEPVLVEVEKEKVKEDEEGKIIVINQSTPSTIEAKTVFIPSSDRAYVDQKISELKNYFLLSPLAPNVNRYYLSRQNDVIVSRVSGSSGSSSSSSGASTLGELSDLTLTSSAYGDLLMYNGSEWVNVATSSLGIAGSGTITSIGDVASGAAFDGTQGTILTFNNAGGDATLDYDGTDFSFSKSISFPYSSSTVYSSFITASTTNLHLGGQSFISLVGNGLDNTSGVLTTNCVEITGSADLCDGNDASGGGSFAWPFDASINYVSTTTTLGLLNGFFSTASSTISGPLSLPGIALNSILSTNGSGLLVATSTPTFGNFNATSTVATSTISSGGFAVGVNKFVVQQNSGNVGIGNSNPSYALDIHITSPTAGQPLFRIGSSNNNTQMYLSDQQRLFVEAGADLGNVQVGSQISSDVITWNQDNASKIDFGSSKVNIASASDLLLSPTAYIGVSTTTPKYLLTIASSTAPQLSLSAGGGNAQWTFRNAGGNFYLSTTTIAGTATTSISALEIAGDGFGTTTIRGLNISGQATSTSNVGYNITSGCYAVGGTCVSGGSSGLSSYDAFSHPFTGFSATTSSFAIGTSTANFRALTIASSTAPQLALSAGAGIAQWTARNAGGNFYLSTTTVDGTATSSLSALTIDSLGSMGIASNTPFGMLSVENASSRPSFVVSDQTNDSSPFLIDASGNVGVGTAAPTGKVHILGAGSYSDGLTLQYTGASTPWNFTQGLDFGMYIGYGTTQALTLASNGNLGVGTDYANPPLAKLQVFATPAQKGSYSASNWNGTGSQLPALISTVNTNGGSSPSTAEPALVLARNGVFNQAYDNYAEFKISRYENDGLNARSRLDIALTHGAGDGAGTNVLSVLSGGMVGIGTTTPKWRLTIATTTEPQLALQGNSTDDIWTFRSIGNQFYIATSSPTTFATTSISALEISGTGFGTTTVRGLNISGQATSTSNVGYNITNGCYAIGGTCVGSSGSSFAWPFDPSTNYVSTTTTLGLLNGFFSTASSTVSGDFYLPSLSQGFAYVGSSGKLNSVASSSINLSSLNNDLATLTATDATLTFSGSYNGSTARTVGLNLSNPNTWSALQTFNYSSSTIYSSFVTASSTNYLGAGLQACDSTSGKLTWSNGQFSCGTDTSGSSDPFSHFNSVDSATTTSMAIGTTTANIAQLTVSSTTAPQLSLSAGAGLNQWTLRNAGGNLYFSTTTVAGTATTTTSAMTLDSSGNLFLTNGAIRQITRTIPSTLNDAVDIGDFTMTNGASIFNIMITVPSTSFSVSKQYMIAVQYQNAPNNEWAVVNPISATGSFISLRDIELDMKVNNTVASFRIRRSLAGGSVTAGTAYVTILQNGVLSDTFTPSTSVTSVSAPTQVSSSTPLSIKNGRLGIGNSTPLALLHVGNNSAATADNAKALIVGESTGEAASLTLSNYAVKTNNMGVSLQFIPRGISDTTTAKIVAISPLAVSSPATDLQFFTYGASLSEKMRITSDGKLGVGETAPGSTLSVSGNATIGASYDTTVAPSNGLIVQGFTGLGTTTPAWQLQVATTSTNGGFKPQLALTDMSGSTNQKHWNLSSLGGNFYLGTSTDSYATTSLSALEIAGSGFGTTTVRGLNISGQATSTSNVGFNITTGCYAIGGVCLSGGSSGLSSYDAWSHPFTGFSATTSSLMVGTSTGYLYGLTVSSSTAPQLALSAGAGLNQWTFRNAGGNFYISTTTVAGTATSSLSVFSILNTGFVGISTSSPTAALSIQATVSTNDLFRVSSTTGASIFSLNKYGSIVQNLSSTSAIQIQDGSGNPVFTVDTTQTTGAGIDITAASGQTANLLNIFQSDGTTNYLAVGSGGNFGIGTGTPSHMFTIATSTTTKEPVFDIYSNNSGATSTVGFFVSTTTGSAAGIGLGLPSALANYILVGNGKVQAGMAIVNGGLCVDDDGWCTASTTGRVSSVTSTTGGTDLAEIYNSNESLQAGDVIAITTPLNFIKLADPAGDKNKTLGVVATDPGIILGLKPGEEQGKGQYPVALAGRVPVKVSNENGNIEAGDYLTLSSQSGVAMKATESGNVVGRALETYSQNGVGKIIMFVSNTYYAGEPSVVFMSGTSTTIYMTSTSTSNSASTTETSASTTATTTSGLSITEGLGQIIVKFLEEIGLKIMDGIAYIKTLFVEKLTVGTPEKPSGITIYDEVTGEPYCLKVVNGAMASVAGECTDVVAPIEEEEPAPIPDSLPVATSTPEQTGDGEGSVATSTEEMATTTLELLPEEENEPNIQEQSASTTVSEPENTPEPEVTAEPEVATEEVVTEEEVPAPSEGD